MKQAIQEYQDARNKLVKAIRKINYRIDKTDILGLAEYTLQKNITLKELRELDKILGEVSKPQTI